MATVRVRGPLKEKTAGLGEHELSGSTVVELLRELERAHPDVRGWILDERGVVRRHINVFVNGELCEGVSPVEPGDRVDVLPAISGG